MLRYCRGISCSLVAVALAGCAAQAQPRSAEPKASAPTPAPVVVDVAPVKEAGPAATPAPAPAKPWVTQPVKADANPQAASVAEALKSGKNPERLSMMIQPKPFSAEAYAKDPGGYLNVVEPGRCFQTAQPGPDVPQLVPATAIAANLQPNQSVQFAVKAPAGSPVSWTSMDLGAFQNSLNAITVAADGSGVATVTFTATPGVSHVVHIIAGSPAASGQVNFQADVQIQGLVPVSESTNPGKP